MPAIPFPDDNPEAWDALRIGSKLAIAPGIVSNISVTRSQRLDVKPGSGKNGATIAAQGYDPAKISIELTIWTEKQWSRVGYLIDALVPKLHNAKPDAVLVSHPVLAAHGITSVVVESIDGPSHPGSNGISKMTLSCVEYFPPPAKPPVVKNVNGHGGINVSTFVQTNDNPIGPPTKPSATTHLP